MHVIIGLMTLMALMVMEITVTEPAEAAEGDRLTLTGDNVNVRDVPGTDGEVVATIDPGETIIEIDARGDWFYVNLPDRNGRGWIYAPLLEKAAGAPPAATEAPLAGIPEPEIPLASVPEPTQQDPLAAQPQSKRDPRELSTEAASLVGDPKAGEQVFYKCGSCHTTVEGIHAQGPSLYGIVGSRPAGSGGYGYSQGMRKFAAEGNIWDEETLDRFIQRPPRVVAGTSMPFSGVRDPQDRKNLIAYLEQISP